MRNRVWLGLPVIVVSLLVCGCVPIWQLGKEKHAEGEPASTSPAAPAAPAAEAPAQPVAPVAAPPTEMPQTPAKQPGMQAALEAAKVTKPGWQAIVHDHNSDWTTVELLAGPTYGDWRVGLNFRWSFRGYELVSEGPLNPPEPTTVIVERPSPPTVIVRERPPAARPPAARPPARPTAQPNLEAARKLARNQFPSGYTTTILRSTGDKRNVVIGIMAPGSRNVIAQVNMHWSDSAGAYRIDSIQR